MSIAEISADPLFPFDAYFESPNAYIGAQQFWMAVLREAAGDQEAAWEPTQKQPNLKDDMYTGLVIDLENISQRRAIKIYTRSVLGLAHFLQVENSLTLEAISSFKSDTAPPETLPHLPISQAENLAEAETILAGNQGFEAGVEQCDFFIESHSANGLDPFVAGECLTIISTISPENTDRAIAALKPFFQPDDSK